MPDEDYASWQITFWKQQRRFSWGFFITALLYSCVSFVLGNAFWALWFLSLGTAVLRIHITQENNFIARRAVEVLSG